MTVSEQENSLPESSIIPGNQKNYIFEGVQEGEGDIALVINFNNHEIGRQRVRLALRDIKTFYRKWHVDTVGDGDTVNTSASTEFVNEKYKYEYAPEKKDLVIYVHGMGMDIYAKTRWTETIFKRLWWQGYKGHVASLEWPDLGLAFYDRSDYRAYQTGYYFERILEWLATTEHAGKVRVLAHSQGNQVVGEALRQLPQSVYVHTYVATQAAVSAHAYDSNLPNDDLNNAPFFTDPTTPEVIRYYSSGIPSGTPPGASYYGGNRAKVGNMYRYFNVQDIALSAWNEDNEMKPDAFYNFENKDGDAALYSEGIDRFYNTYITGVDSYGNPIYSQRDLHIGNILERYEIFSYCAESRARALGAVAGTVANIPQYNLQNALLLYDNMRYSHSRQFRSDIVREWPYWAQFYSNCGLNN